jgi:hypothetical protein
MVADRARRRSSNLQASSVKDFACLGRRDALALPLDQLLIETLFQHLDLLADGGLRNKVERGGFGETAGLNQITERFERLDVHDGIIRQAYPQY